MTSLLGVRNGLRVEPRVLSVPGYRSSAGDEAVELAAMAGLVLDDWQQFVLRDGLGEGPDGKWAAFEVAVVAPRQNGKNAIFEARELAGLFLLGEQMIIHSAHEFATSSEAFRRLEYLIQNTPEFDRRVKKGGYRHSHGEEGIELKTGQRIHFKTRTKGGGRGFTGDCLIMDEAMILQQPFMGALLPILSGDSVEGDPQVWYGGSPVDQTIHEHGLVLAAIRARALAGGDRSLAYFEWSADAENPSDVTDDQARDEESWLQANPGLDIRISRKHVERERAALASRQFAVERLGVGDWPSTDGDGAVISLAQWNELCDVESKRSGPVAFSFDVSPDRASSAICASGRRADGLLHVEVVDHRRGTGWVVERLVELSKKHNPNGIVYANPSPATSLVPELEDAGVDVVSAGASEHAQACGLIFDAVDQRKLRHLGTLELSQAIRGAAKRPLGDAWAWSRKTSTVDISPLVAVTLAHWGALTLPGEPNLLPPIFV